MTTPTPQVTPGEKPSALKVLKDQKKTVLVALTLVVATYWIAGQLGEWRLAAGIAGFAGVSLVQWLITKGTP